MRTAYTAWITAGDVLAAVLEQMPQRRPDFRAVMRTFIHNELRADQYVNLGQAGHREADRTPLARVFVDLPVNQETWKDGLPPSGPDNDESSFEEEESQEAPPAGAMTDLLGLAAQRLDPASNPRREQSAPSDLRKATVPGRVVLIGGPGQGKSTLSQFLCQVHRAALLALDLNSSPPPEVMDAYELIRDQCDAESLALPTVPRFPLRVVLNHFAKALAEQTVPSLFAYLRARIAGCAERDIDADDLHLWLGAYPWLLVLDGLDEVPASSNRSQVLDSIHNFLVIAHNANADLLLVATSRPQGYNDDFAARYYRHRQLLPLDVNRALHYAERLAKERWGGDPDRVDRVLTRLHRAGAEEATARLMHSPLQVAIMTLLVDSAGEPPRERWRLFSEYYRVIYDRERQRDILAARLLSEYQTDIDAIHQRVAQRLQVESERAGGTDATLDAVAFAALVDQRLVEEEYPDADRAELTHAITEAALHRLVFLVAPSEGAVGFEVRSLQEFMAAQCLTNGSDAEIAGRLRAIAPAAHWRNVFLFAAGRCFHERQHLRDTLHTLCCELNEGEGVPGGGDLERATLAGSQLALEILEDGTVARQPAKLKLFARLALRLMDLPPCGEQIRIAEQYQPALEDAYRQEIRNRLADGEVERRLGAWRVLLRLVGRGYEWARSQADGQWPKDSAEVLMIFRAATDVEGGAWLGKHWRQAVPKLHPEQIIQFGPGPNPHGWLKATPVWARWEAMFRFRERVLSCRLEGLPENSCLSLIPIQAYRGQARATPPGARRDWHWLAAARNFALAPSKEALGRILGKLAEGDLDHDMLFSRAIGGSLSWPLQACHTALAQGADLGMLIAAAHDGSLGDRTDWEQAEQRWQDKGVTGADLSYQPENALPFDSSIACRGFPLGEHFFDDVWDLLATGPGKLLSLWRNASNIHSRWLAQGLLFQASLSCESGIIWNDLDPVQFRRLIGEANEWCLPLNLLMVLPESCWTQGDGLDAMTTLGETARLDFLDGIGGFEQTGPRLEALAAVDPSRGGILRLLAHACRYGYRPSRDDLHPDLDTYADPRHQAAALLVQLALGRWDEAKGSAFARHILDLQQHETEIVDDALDILAGEHIGDRPKDCLLTALYAALPATAWEIRRRVMGVMQSQQRRRLSTSIP